MITLHILLGIVTISGILYAIYMNTSLSLRTARVLSGLQTLSGLALWFDSRSLRACVSIGIFVVLYVALEATIYFRSKKSQQTA